MAAAPPITHASRTSSKNQSKVGNVLLVGGLFSHLAGAH
jgi:hypothetical protein